MQMIINHFIRYIGIGDDINWICYFAPYLIILLYLNKYFISDTIISY